MQAILKRDEVLFRFSALGALGGLAKPASVPEALIALAEQDILRKAVFDCLGSISDESSFKLLLSGFSCFQKNSRAAAVKALYKIYARSAPEPKAIVYDALRLLKESEIINGLLDFDGCRDIVLTEALIWISSVTRDVRFIPLLIETYADERFTDTAFESLKSFGSEALLEITSRYEGLDESGRSGLCILIGECGYSGFNDIIRKALCDQSAQVRKAAAIAVGKLGLISSIPDLISLVDDPEVRVNAAAVASLQSLVMISRSSIIAEVDYFFSSTKSHHRIAAALLLASLGEPGRLQLLLKDKNSQVRIAAVTALGAGHTEQTGSMFVPALTDQDPEVRIAAADALGTLQDASTLEALELAINDEDIWVQSALIKAIASIDSSRALLIIKNFHTEAEGLLMITSLKILDEIGGAEAEKIIHYALQSVDPDIARQAAKSLDRITSGCS
jgi:HEAT repeat protein